MTRNAPEPEPSAADDERAAGDIDAAEFEELEDDAERARQKNRSALIGLVALILTVVLAGIGFWATATAPSAPPNPEIARMLPPPPASP